LGETVMLAVYQGTDNKAGLGAAVFFLFLHVGFYSFCIDASTYVYGSEIWPTFLRAKGFAISVAGLFVGSLILLVSAPTAFANIGWRFYIVMLVCTAIFAVIALLCFPETKGLPLEEIAAKFGDEVTVHLMDEAGLRLQPADGPEAEQELKQNEKSGRDVTHERLDSVKS
jgi:MFS family permease